MPDFSKAKVGDRVWCARGPEVGIFESNATIVDFDDSMTDRYPIKVRYDVPYNREASFRIDGKELTSDAMPNMYWTRPQIIGGDVPPKRMKKCFVNGWVVYNHDLDRFTQVYRCEQDMPEVCKNEMVIHIHHEYEVEE